MTRIAALLGLIAGVLHLWIAPEHFEHAPAHGLTFAAAGFLQCALAVAGWRVEKARKVLGVLNGALIALWALATWARTPFSQTHEDFGAMAIIIKLAEAGGMLLAGPWRTWLWSLLLGFGVWGAALVAEPAFPNLAHQHAHVHVHGQPVSGVIDRADWVQNGSFAWGLPAHVPEPLVPANNPMTAEKQQLGRRLFYDKRLSGNGTQSCASCHQQARAFADSTPVSIGSTGQHTARNSMALVNAAYNGTQTWANPTLATLEAQILVPLFGEFPIEMGVTGREDQVLARLRADPEYARMFAAAFPNNPEPAWGNVVQALASFVRGMVSVNSRYDRYLQGDANALSQAELRGLSLFLSEELECHHCHTGFNFSASTMHAGSTFVERPFFNTGLYNVGGAGAYPQGNQGLYEISGLPEDRGAFRPPTLRNVALTAPYMHDGSIDSLEQVLDMYARGGRLIENGPNAGDGRQSKHKSGLVSGFVLSPADRQALLAFLRALTDESFITNPAFADPFVP